LISNVLKTASNGITRISLLSNPGPSETHSFFISASDTNLAFFVLDIFFKYVHNLYQNNNNNSFFLCKITKQHQKVPNIFFIHFFCINFYTAVIILRVCVALTKPYHSYLLKVTVFFTILSHNVRLEFSQATGRILLRPPLTPFIHLEGKPITNLQPIDNHVLDAIKTSSQRSLLSISY
jgi:hypothetical protein